MVDELVSDIIVADPVYPTPTDYPPVSAPDKFVVDAQIMTTCAVCQLSNGLVLNVIVADTSDPAPDECQLILTPDSLGIDAQIGRYWNGLTFNDGVINA